MSNSDRGHAYIAVIFLAAVFMLAGALADIAPLYGGSIALLTVAMIALGAQKRDSLGPLRWPLTALLAVLFVSLLVVLLMSKDAGAGHLIFGLPPRAAVTLLAVWLAPLPLALLAYLFTFDSFTLTESDLEELHSYLKRKSDR